MTLATLGTRGIPAAACIGATLVRGKHVLRRATSQPLTTALTGRRGAHPRAKRAASAPSRGRCGPFHAPLYISFVMIHTEQTGGVEMASPAMAKRAHAQRLPPTIACRLPWTCVTLGPF
jgi:hypothetical protein